MKCFIFECKSRGYFCDPNDQSEHFCATHRRNGMVSIKSIGGAQTRVKRHTIMLDDTQGLRTKDVPKPKRRTTIKVQLSPPRAPRTITIPGAPKKPRRVTIISTVEVIMESFDSDAISEDEYAPLMDIYAEIRVGQFQAGQWMQSASAIPLTAYLTIAEYN